ncbi:GNAT family N-acetyltransferase [Granulicella cerasi]|uniref:GNAT family N-acetyltransferase n=1 Tax=Granulicella cerasi TaxID=741063 RepID=A0ABW1ZDE4_9BACT|nr:GNAT family N-acetyltransferase [Granulicella cerasi]
MSLAEPSVDVLDLRHFSGAQLAPLLRDEAERWQARLHWQYDSAATLLLEYLNTRVLPGYAAYDRATRSVVGYGFCVYEANKAVLGDIYAFDEAEGRPSPLVNRLLDHLLEMLMASPGIDRIESQLLMYPPGSFAPTLDRYGFQSFPRQFLMAPLSAPQLQQPAMPLVPGSGLRLERWRPEHMHGAAALIQRSYQDHGDALINDQYRTVAGAERFLHNIIRFPGCGDFDAEHSLVLVDQNSGKPQALLLCSRVHQDTAHITQLCIAPSLRGLGLGRMMLTICAQQLWQRGLRHVSLTVTEDNAQALKLYNSLGFSLLQRFEAIVWNKR